MKSPAYMAAHVRRVLLDGASAPHSEEVQRFFKEEVASRGWYTAELRKVAYRFHRVLVNEHGLDYLVSVANQLFRGRVLEEKTMAVMLLEKSVHDFGPKQFRRFDQWLDRVSSWADHDALLHYLIGPMIVDEPSRVRLVFVWARSRNRWRRRASAVALIRGARRRMFRGEIARLSEMLLDDADDMVRSGVAVARVRQGRRRQRGETADETARALAAASAAHRLRNIARCNASQGAGKSCE